MSKMSLLGGLVNKVNEQVDRINERKEGIRLRTARFFSYMDCFLSGASTACAVTKIYEGKYAQAALTFACGAIFGGSAYIQHRAAERRNCKYLKLEYASEEHRKS